MTLRILKKYPEGIMGYNDELVYYRMSSNSMSSKKKNKGAGKRVWNDFKNDVAIAKKYKGDVPLSIYMKRMINLITNQIYVRIAWLLKRKNI